MWKKGRIEIEGVTYNYLLKVLEEPSKYGIDRGKISKLTIIQGGALCSGETVVRYDREWVIKPTHPYHRAVLKRILDEFN